MTTDIRRGMTLIEVLVATVLSGILMLSATRLVASIQDTAARTRTDAASGTKSALEARVLRRYLHNAQSPFDSIGRFVGQARSLDFVTLCVDARGVLLRCSMRVVIEDSANVHIAVARVHDDVIWTRRSAQQMELRFLSSRGSAWRSDWATRGLPAAVAFMGGDDTLVLPVGAGP